MLEFLKYSLVIGATVVVGLIIAAILIAIARRIRPEGASSGSGWGMFIGRGLQLFGVLLMCGIGTVLDETMQMVGSVLTGISALGYGGHIVKAAREA